MNSSFIVNSVGKLLQILGLVLIIPALIGVYEVSPNNFHDYISNPAISGFTIAIPLSLLIGTLLTLIKPTRLIGNGTKEGFAIVAFGWMVLTLFGAIPLFMYFVQVDNSFTIHKVLLYATNSYFEIMSGFTTTGSTILTDIEALPKSLLFWRSLTHWLGGMGIVTLALAIFPASGVTAYQMFRGEVPGPTAEKIRPNLGQTAKVLWGVYALLTLIETLLLKLGGMPLFDSICHSFGTLATGGFSTQNASIAAYHSAYFDWVIIVFMFLAGMNFLIHYQVIFNRDLTGLKKNSEFHFYTLVVVLASLFTATVLYVKGLPSAEIISHSFRSHPFPLDQIEAVRATEAAKVSTFLSSLRYSFFQVLSVTTTTGYATADFDMWPNVIRTLFIILMFFGGSAGSTGGGIKMIRIQVIMKAMRREIEKMVQPRIVKSIKLGDTPVEEKQVNNIIGFVVLYALFFVVLSFIMSFFIEDFSTAVTSVVATLSNIGPGISGVGATENFNWIPIGGKWVLTFAMLLGRLELYTVVIALSPKSWKY